MGQGIGFLGKRGGRMSTVQTWVTGFTAHARSSAGAKLPWLAATRQRAIERFAAEGWPTSRQEAWRHTSLAVLEQQSFLDAGKPSVAQFAQQLRGDEPGHWLVFVDGRHAP